MKNTQLNKAYKTAIHEARDLIDAGELDSAFKKIETAHVLGQRQTLRHIETHWLMLKIGYQRHSIVEVFGQLLRIILGALGSSIGIVPTGNTGGTNVNLFQRMPIAPELEKLLYPKNFS